MTEQQHDDATDSVGCAECGELCDPRYRNQEWGEWRDASGRMRRVHKWCVETWAAAMRAGEPGR